MKLENLQRKAATLGKLTGRTYTIGMMQRRYRLEDSTNGGEGAPFGPVYMSAKALFDQMDTAETAIRLYARLWPFGRAAQQV